jgi:hypothetical protein
MVRGGRVGVAVENALTCGSRIERRERRMSGVRAGERKAGADFGGDEMSSDLPGHALPASPYSFPSGVTMRRILLVVAILVLGAQFGCGWDFPEVEKASLKKGFMKPPPPDEKGRLPPCVGLN